VGGQQPADRGEAGVDVRRRAGGGAEDQRGPDGAMIATRRRRCRRRSSRSWRSSSPERISSASTSCGSTALPRSVFRFAATTASRYRAGTSSQPTRSAGASSFDTLPA
jgi:hypothetical protein